jgi:hypothetical protein
MCELPSDVQTAPSLTSSGRSASLPDGESCPTRSQPAAVMLSPRQQRNASCLASFGRPWRLTPHATQGLAVSAPAVRLPVEQPVPPVGQPAPPSEQGAPPAQQPAPPSGSAGVAPAARDTNGAAASKQREAASAPGALREAGPVRTPRRGGLPAPNTRKPSIASPETKKKGKTKRLDGAPEVRWRSPLRCPTQHGQPQGPPRPICGRRLQSSGLR